MANKKVLIAVPCMDMVSAQFCQSLATLKKYIDTEVIFQIGSLVYTSRNNLAGLAVKGAYDYVFWLDSDMVFAPETLGYMVDVLEEKDLDILSGLYFRRQPPFTPVVFSKLKIDEEGCHWENRDDIPSSLFECEGIGFGCVLMRTGVFVDVFNKYGAPFTPIAGVGEDLSFCWRAREMGYKIHVDPNILLGHVGYQLVTKQFYDVYKGKLNVTDSEVGDEIINNSI